MSTKIQFKKLVWWTEEDGSTLSSTGLFEFVIFQEAGLCMLEIYSIAGFQRRMVSSTIEDAQRKAQVWFEEMLIKFIETSETPAK